MTSSIFTQEQCTVLFQRIQALAEGGGHTHIWFSAQWDGTTRWARGLMQNSAEEQRIRLGLRRMRRGAYGLSVMTTRLDDAGLLEAIRLSERHIMFAGEVPANEMHPPRVDPILAPTLWNDETAELSPEARADIARDMLEAARAQGLSAAGSVTVSMHAHASIDSQTLSRYYPVTDVQISMTARDPKAGGSGWAGQHDYTIAKIDSARISERAIEKCIKSRNPVAIEPGRYTAILEPQAVADLFSRIMQTSSGETTKGINRAHAETGSGPFAKRRDYSKIGDRVLDSRFTLRSDPMDPDGGFVPFERYGSAYQPTNWIERGVLKELAYNREYALEKMGRDLALPHPLSYRLSADGPLSTLEEMIASTERGLLVSRFSNVQTVDGDTVLCSGYTRDGIWLIERGKITKPVKNFRFVESPMFVFNNVEAIGTPVRVFTPPFARVVPPVKVRDFNFASLADAV